jgi:DNA-binding transcriptional regulator YhcF (GntR family)
VDVGDQMPTTQDFAKMVDVGFGTVEKAVTFLKVSKAIETRARGQMGTFLISKDVQALWRIGNLGTLIGLLPLPHGITFM